MGNVCKLGCQASYHAHDHVGTKTEDLRIQREKEGRCGDCGRRTHEVKHALLGGVVKKIPLQIPGKVDDGSCLRCNPPTIVDSTTNTQVPTVTTTTNETDNSVPFVYVTAAKPEPPQQDASLQISGSDLDPIL